MRGSFFGASLAGALLVDGMAWQCREVLVVIVDVLGRRGREQEVRGWQRRVLLGPERSGALSRVPVSACNGCGVVWCAFASAHGALRGS